MRPTRDRVERCAQFVTQGAEELVLDAICFLGLDTERALLRQLSGEASRLPVTAHNDDASPLRPKAIARKPPAVSAGRPLQTRESVLTCLFATSQPGRDIWSRSAGPMIRNQS